MTNEINKQTASTMTSQSEQPAAKIEDGTSTTSTAASTPPAPTFRSLPAGYLANGSMLDADGIMRPEYLDKYAEELAKRLKPLSASSFRRAFLTKATEASKKKTPYSTKKNCAQGMVIQAMKLTARAKDPAPGVLLDMMKLAAASVKDPESFSAMYTHLEAICAYLLMN